MLGYQVKSKVMKLNYRINILIRKIRKYIAKAIKPSHPSPNPEWDIPIGLNLKAAEALREHLNIDEKSFLFVHGQAWADTRAYLIYTALDEVQKTSMYLMRLQEFFEEEKVDPKSGRLERLIMSHVLEEQHARIRRLLELLVVLILSDKTNEQKYYRHYLLLEELDDLISSNDDQEEFYGSRSVNIDDSIEHQITWIKKVELDLDLSKCWYLRDKQRLKEKENLRPGSILSSMRQRIKLALPEMTAFEKLVFGFSYRKGTFGISSENVHYTPNRKDIFLQGDQESFGIKILGMICFAIIKRCHELLEKPTIAIVNKVLNALDNLDTESLIKSITIGEISVGDFVLAYGDLAEVLEVSQTDYGYKSYKIKYLAEKPKPNIQEDWFPAAHIKKLYTRGMHYINLTKSKTILG
jgi:hypothetical protein